VLTLVLAPAQLATADPAPDAGTGAIYRRPLGHDPETLDPVRISDIYSRSVAQQIFDGLVQFDQTLSVAPALAQFWKASRDGLTWTFMLRKGVRFHHGREVTADDVVYSLTRLLDPRTRSGAADLFVNVRGARAYREGRASRVAGLVAVDRHTVRIELEEALAPFVSALAVGHAKIVPRELVEQQGEAFGRRPVGTGPFRFVRWERGKEIVLAANPHYYDGAPRLAGVTYRIFAGDQWDGPFREFQQGGLEDTPPPTRDYRRVVQDPGHLYVKRPMISVRFYGFNTQARPLDDRRLRQALLHGLDRATLLDDVLLGRYAAARGILPPGTLGFNPAVPGYPHDRVRAAELLAEAGYPEGRGLPPIAIWSSVRHETMLREHDHIRRSWQAIGVKAEFHYLTDWPTFAAGLAEGRFPVFLYAWYADVPDPDNFLAKLFHSRSPRNFFRYANPAVDALLAEARAERELARRVDLYRKVERLVLDDAPVIPILHHTYERLFQPYVRSVEVNGLGDPYIPLRKIWLERPR
jgi:oligopeptide transport system substrate-binding protein